jgi:hypothetical protein
MRVDAKLLVPTEDMTSNLTAADCDKKPVILGGAFVRASCRRKSKSLALSLQAAKEWGNRVDLAELARLVGLLSPIQAEVVGAVIKRFVSDLDSKLVIEDFLTANAFEYFSMRLAAHHAISSHPLKKENFEHILKEAFQRNGISAVSADSMTNRGADLTVDGVTLSLKTEAARNLQLGHITISKLMEGGWIKHVSSEDEIPSFIESMVMPHFENYERIFILRSYSDRKREGFVRYDLREIPKDILQRVGNLKGQDFKPRTPTGTTSAEVELDGTVAFNFRLDGSVDKLTVTNLDVNLCPLHAWWSLAQPG